MIIAKKIKMKQLEISKLNIKDLEAKIIELKKKLFDLRMSSYVSELENPVQIRNTKMNLHY